MSLSVGILLWLHVEFAAAGSCDGRKQIVWTDVARGMSHNYTVSLPEMHMKFMSFYVGNGRPPMKEAYLLHSVPLDALGWFLNECLGLVVTAELLVLEANLMVSSHDPMAEARFAAIWSRFNSLSEPSTNELLLLWPIAAAVTRVNAALTTRTNKTSTIDIVICHCTEPLDSLLAHFASLSSTSRLFVYEKCGTRTPISSFPGSYEIIDQKDGPVRGDECTGYLDHIIQHYESLSDFTVFLQDDADHHMFLSYLDTALRGITLRQYNVPFLHLNFHRHYQTTTPCMRDVERALFDLSEPVSPLPLIGTYCCAQFIVEKSRIHFRAKSFYENAFLLVNGSVPDLCSPTPPRRSSHCYVLEYLWHVVFGEDRFLPHKPDDSRLPLLLRMKNGNENAKIRWDDIELLRGGWTVLKRSVDIGLFVGSGT